MKILTLMVFVWFSLIATAQQVPVNPAYMLVLDEEFTGNRINRQVWDLHYPWGQSVHDSVTICNGGKPNAIKVPRAYRTWDSDTHNIKVSNGICQIITQKETYTGDYWDYITDENGATQLVSTRQTVDFTTGMLYSKKQYWRGYYEVKFRLPKGAPFPMSYAAFGPNFWLYAGDCWNEIDLFEVINAQTLDFSSSVHYESMPTMQGADTICGGPLQSQRTNRFFKRAGAMSGGEWHVASFDWQAERVIFYLDGKEYHRAESPAIAGMRPMNIIIDVNAPMYNCIGLTSWLTKLPYVYDIEYVKVWQAQ